MAELRGQRTATGLMAIAVAPFTGVAAMIVSNELLRAVTTPTWFNLDRAITPLGIAVDLVQFSGSIALALVVWVALMNRSVRRAIRRRLAQAVCLGCGYPLLGLPIHEGVVCPECGRRIVLAEEGLTEATLFAPAPEGCRSGTRRTRPGRAAR